ncbi:hypothetical protein [Rhodococcus sp. LW-XY12]|uniref:hypothetical protein n=1 Tax=Rhodococcus sp. LW-XY12 TaxID=2856851 RepID=UPI001C59AEA5|nr:hypothetical protein [Rhodococcus sp. LW-XY12]QXU56579.1 hypothetical protein KXC42_26000 [Rhodococcus sp. LW-XY12]
MNTLLNSVQDFSTPLVILCVVLFVLMEGRAVITLLATCATFIALFASGERADRASLILEALLATLKRLGRGGDQR